MHMLYIPLSRNVENVTECGEHLLISATTTNKLSRRGTKSFRERFDVGTYL